MFVYSPAPAHAPHQPADEWERKRAQHLFDLSQESCQEQSALETPRGGMDLAVPVVLLTAWSLSDLWSRGPWSSHGVVTGTPQLPAHPSSHPAVKECLHHIKCFVFI